MNFLILITFFLYTNPVFAELIPSLNIIREKAPFPGYIYRPNNTLSHPAIILLHGSEGGNGDFWYQPGQAPIDTGENGLVPYLARYYAMLGYVTYAICYFDCKHHDGFTSYPPDDLKNVDLMKATYPALSWLKSYKFVDQKKVILWGASRGAEQALLLATRLTELQKEDSSIILPDGVVSLSPIEQITPALSQEVADAIIGGQPFTLAKDESAWLINGEKQINFDVINISKFPNPVLITSFQKDPVWKYINMQDLKNQYQPKDLVSIQMASGDSAKEKIREIPNTFGRITFFEILDTGHVFPTYGSEESKMMDQILQQFFQHTLNP